MSLCLIQKGDCCARAGLLTQHFSIFRKTLAPGVAPRVAWAAAPPYPSLGVGAWLPLEFSRVGQRVWAPPGLDMERCVVQESNLGP